MSVPVHGTNVEITFLSKANVFNRAEIKKKKKKKKHEN